MDFLAISYNLPANPSRYRVATWKTLKELGAIYLQPGVAILPVSQAAEQAFLQLRDNIRSWNGKSALLTMKFQEKADEEDILSSFSNARTEEYREIQDDAERLLAQMKWEKKTKAESWDMALYALEYRRLHRRLDTAVQHDFFEAKGREEAQAALLALSADLPEETQTKVIAKTALSPSAKPKNTKKKKSTSKPLQTSTKKPMTSVNKADKADKHVPTALETAQKVEELLQASEQRLADEKKQEEREESGRQDMPVFLF